MSEEITARDWRVFVGGKIFRVKGVVTVRISQLDKSPLCNFTVRFYSSPTNLSKCLVAEFFNPALWMDEEQYNIQEEEGDNDQNQNEAVRG